MSAEFALRIAGVSLAAFAGAGLAITVLIPVLARRWATGTALQRAQRLAWLRLLPTVVAAFAGALTLSAFLMFEPRIDGEEIGLTAPALAVFGALLLATSFWRGVQLVRATRTTVTNWMRSAKPVALEGISAPTFAVEADFPVVCVVGFFKPRLLIARSVLDCCSEEELGAILAHEQGHIDRRDNLRRLLISIAPDLLNWLPASTRLCDAWREAAEEAADDDAVKRGADGRVRLAEALVKVARLAPAAGRRTPMPASALYRGESLDRRVRRLLNDCESGSGPRSMGWPMSLAATAVVVLALTSLQSIHGLVETLIHRLP